MRRLALAAAAVGLAVTLAAPRAAEARWVDLHAGLRAGGLVGWGTGSGEQTDFFERTRGPGVGFDMGLKLLVFDLSANFLQVFDGDGRAGTLTQLLLGFEIDLPVGRTKLPDGHSQMILRPGIAGGVGFGTPRPVAPPLSNAQISDKGIVSHAKLAYEFFLNPFVGVGAEANFGYHYFLWGQTVNGPASSGYQLAGLGTVTFHLGY